MALLPRVLCVPSGILYEWRKYLQDIERQHEYSRWKDEWREAARAQHHEAEAPTRAHARWEQVKIWIREEAALSDNE